MVRQDNFFSLSLHPNPGSSALFLLDQMRASYLTIDTPPEIGLYDTPTIAREPETSSPGEIAAPEIS